jgi:hypothetical protein
MYTPLRILEFMLGVLVLCLATNRSIVLFRGLTLTKESISLNDVHQSSKNKVVQQQLGLGDI